MFSIFSWRLLVGFDFVFSGARLLAVAVSSLGLLK
jgi:hypothetical protein